MRAISAMFARYPEVKNSSVEVESSDGGIHPGQFGGHGSARARDRQPVRMRARSAQAADGMTVRDAITFHAHRSAVPAGRGRD